MPSPTVKFFLDPANRLRALCQIFQFVFVQSAMSLIFSFTRALLNSKTPAGYMGTWQAFYEQKMR